MKRVFAALMVALVLLVVDLRQSPSDQWSSRLAIASIHAYQGTLSRWYSYVGLQCRFVPTCSHYGEECIRRFGAARGSWLALKRVVRCGPWTPLGTGDPPPQT